MPGHCNLFIWANNTGIHCDGRTLVWMKDVDASGGAADGKIDYGVNSMEIALAKV